MPDYTFTQPIRYYKSNDPYYFEIDNIPIRQLEENILHLKKGIEDGTIVTGSDSPGGGGAGGGFLTEASELDLTKIKQLRPKLLSNRTVSVNAGKFNARINDAYDVQQPLTRLIATTFNDAEADSLATEEPTIIPGFNRVWDQVDVANVWSNFTDSNSLASFNMNGLETTYTFHQSPNGIGNKWVTTAAINLGFDQLGEEGGGSYPHYDIPEHTNIRWPGQTHGRLTPDILNSFIKYGEGYQPSTLQDIHLSFVKMWKSVFRTAVVDFPDSSIEIPAWDDDDYYYYDSNDVLTQVDGVTQRIDLLFAYALPIDASSTTISDYTGLYCAPINPGAPKTLTTPTLGIIRGAGVGLNIDLAGTSSSTDKLTTTESCGDPGQPGSKRILSNKNDELATSNNGITNSLGVKVHGSFPSPDDLINQAANLATLSGDSAYSLELQLVGQTAIPLAYIVVRKGSANIIDSDIIDIRPFLRTTELSYNERAGVAAASPALSLANPAVGAYQLKDTVRRVYNKIQAVAQGTQSTSLGKPVYMDYVMGGLAYGVEGTMLTMNNHNSDATDPWGSITRGITNYDTYSFEDYVSSKIFLEDATPNRRKALLEYFYKERQDDLKRWLSNPNESSNSNTYLNLTSTRNIPIFPEWQPVVGSDNYADVFNSTANQSAEPTWWMWLEGVSKERPLRYVPGGVVSTEDSENSANLDVEYAPGYGPSDQVAEGFLQTCMKKIVIRLPSWAHDYDILAEYVNCTPYSGHIDNSANKNQILLGNGISVNKGAVGPDNTATFTITSSAQGLPAGPEGLVYQGKILDQFGNGTTNINAQLSHIKNRHYEWLCYSVCLPEFKETGWRTGTQAGAQSLSYMRYTPKMGASFYPTVKFTVIAYPESPVNKNLSYQEGGANFSSKTLIPDSTQSGVHNNFSNVAPVYDSTYIDVNNISY